MLIRYYIIFVLGIDWLIMRRNVNFIVWKFVFAEVFEEVRVSCSREVDVGVGRVFGLGRDVSSDLIMALGRLTILGD